MHHLSNIMLQVTANYAIHCTQDDSLYDAAQKIEYLDMVWQESLRMYDPTGM